MKIITALIVLIAIPLLSICQTTVQAANQAFIITRMVNKFHVEPRPLNTAFSVDVFNGMLVKTDKDKLFFTKTDISKLNLFRNKLNGEITGKKTDFLNLFTSIYKQRLHQADSLINEMNKKPFNYYTAEKLSVAEDTTYPVSVAAIQVKLYKKIKLSVIDGLANELPPNFKSYNPLKQKKYIDSALVVWQKRVISSTRRRVNNVLQNPHGIVQYSGNLYCQTIASCYDPHTEFLPPQEKENFESALGKQPFKFGFTIKSDKNDGVLIDNLQPGSPAFKSGKLNKGDKFISLQMAGKPVVDVSEMEVQELGTMVDEANHQKVLFTIKKVDGSVIQVPLEKQQVTGDEDDKVKSFILKGANTIGYIYLPAFYEDWASNSNGLNGCANDVGREILKLKKENINGLILDLRYNGGGSVQEATELAGIFIDAGPVALAKTRAPKIAVLKDVNRGTIYDGPLVILVNGYSASAAELLAGTLQDYNRAVIIGSPTYGKATMQIVMPMDTTVTPQNFVQARTENLLKVTVGKLYRVNGTSAQFQGVQPDIVLPDILDAYITKEADEPNALRPTAIDANKFYTPETYLPIKTIAQNIQPEIDTSKYFNAVKKVIAKAREKKLAKDVSLQIYDAVNLANSDVKSEEAVLTIGIKSKKYAVQTNQYEAARLQADEGLKELNAAFVKQVATDACINIAYDVLLKLKP